MRSLAKIGPNTTTPELVEPAHPRSKKKDEVNMNNLPTGIRETFRDAFVPLLREFVGTASPWESPSADMTFNMWSLAHSDANSQLDDGLMWMVFTLVSDSRTSALLSTMINLFTHLG